MYDDDLEDEDAPQTQYRVTAGEVRQFVERVERLEAEKREVMDSIKEVYAEAKGRGYSVPALRKLVADRKKDAAELQEFESLVELYRNAIGL